MYIYPIVLDIFTLRCRLFNQALLISQESVKLQILLFFVNTFICFCSKSEACVTTAYNIFKMAFYSKSWPLWILR